MAKRQKGSSLLASLGFRHAFRRKASKESPATRAFKAKAGQGYSNAVLAMHRARIEAQYKIKKRFRPGIYD